MKSFIFGVALLALAGCTPAVPDAGEPKSFPTAETLALRSEPVEIGPGKLNGLRLRGTRVLSADHQAFGGFSGILVETGRLRAVSDAGWWLEARLQDETDGLEPVEAQILPLRGPDGELFDKAGGDAEALADINGTVRIAFERDHRIMTLGQRGEVSRAMRDRAFERLGTNKGLEALAAFQDGRLLAIAEAAGSNGHPVFILDGEALQLGSLPEAKPYSVTGADLGPDGRLYLVMRYFSALTGVRIRIDRMSLAPDGMPDPTTRQVLATYESASGIDNMEGISLWTDSQGRSRLTLISDDNFNFVQRTLLMDFELTE